LIKVACEIEDIKIKLDKIAGMIYILSRAFSDDLLLDNVLVSDGIDGMLDTIESLQKDVTDLNQRIHSRLSEYEKTLEYNEAVGNMAYNQAEEIIKLIKKVGSDDRALQ